MNTIKLQTRPELLRTWLDEVTGAYSANDTVVIPRNMARAWAEDALAAHELQRQLRQVQAPDHWLKQGVVLVHDFGNAPVGFRKGPWVKLLEHLNARISAGAVAAPGAAVADGPESLDKSEREAQELPRDHHLDLGSDAQLQSPACALDGGPCESCQ